MDADAERCFLRLVCKRAEDAQSETSLTEEAPSSSVTLTPTPPTQMRCDLITSCLMQACGSSDHLRARGAVATATGMVGDAVREAVDDCAECGGETTAFYICATAVGLYCEASTRDTTKARFVDLVYTIARRPEDHDGRLVRACRAAYEVVKQSVQTIDPSEPPAWMQTAISFSMDASSSYKNWLCKQFPDTAPTKTDNEVVSPRHATTATRMDKRAHYSVHDRFRPYEYTQRTHTTRHHPHPSARGRYDTTPHRNRYGNRQGGYDR